ncbi:transcription elongation factor GreAB [Oleomonas cavernae]|uniref:Transcription elongation factor GreAB n=1 Tax=Oleomonas cavernae TaxID=2320859 RepID=A0A418WE47_9PROT|nr:GreA/GreB family elongation factor [Oleomonas cavernae]RJF88293.1 transcription elongation factor GreAB [Oleomonas cavernae]
MSRAFVREDDTATGDAERPPVAPHRITPSGLQALQARRLALEGAEGMEAENERSRLDALIQVADVVPALTVPPETARFGARVVAVDEDDEELAVTLVGEHEADPAAGKINYLSPLGRALIGAAIGDTVIWQRPAGARGLEIIDLTLPSA